MANLISPGVQVTVVDESFYTPAEPGTRPLFIVASAENKSNGSGTGIAPGTLAANAEKVYLLTSQRDLVDTFGDPIFKIDANNNPIHASEMNEYGLQAAYSYLGVSNSAFVTRANFDLDRLTPQADQPGGEPQDGTFWLDTANTEFGIFEWNGNPATTKNGQSFSNIEPLVITDDADFSDGIPNAGIGKNGSYAIIPAKNSGVTGNNVLNLYYKSRFKATGATAGSAWVKVGSEGWMAAWPVVSSTINPVGGIPAGVEGTVTLTVLTSIKNSSGVNISIPITTNGTSNPLNATKTIANVKTAIETAIDAAIVAIDTTDRAVQTAILANGSSTAADKNAATKEIERIDRKVAALERVGLRLVDGYLQIYTRSFDIVRLSLSSTADGVLTSFGITPGNYLVLRTTIAPHNEVPDYKIKSNKSRPTGSIWVKTTTPNSGANWKVRRYNSDTKLWQTMPCPVFKANTFANKYYDPKNNGLSIPLNTVYCQTNISDDINDIFPTIDFRLMRRADTGVTSIKTLPIVAHDSPLASQTTKYASFVPASGTSPNATLADVLTFRLGESTPRDTNTSSIISRQVTVTLTGTAADAVAIAEAINTFPSSYNNGYGTELSATVTNDNEVVISHLSGGEIYINPPLATDEYLDTSGTTTAGTTINPLAVFEKLRLVQNNRNVLYRNGVADNVPFDYVASNWSPLLLTPDTATQKRQSYYISENAPETLSPNDTLWYSSIVDEVDIMVHNGDTWVGYKNGAGNSATNSTGPIVSASEPTLQTDGTALVENDLWIDTSDIEHYPVIRRYNTDFVRWDTIDNTDQTTENGILFADARQGTDGGTASSNTAPSGTIAELLTSNYLDTDAPDPALYPKGMLLWNLRRSGFNVKRLVHNYVVSIDENERFSTGYNDQTPATRTEVGDSQESYYPHRWVTESANKENGAGNFGRHAQRAVVVQHLQALVNSNQELRDAEVRNFNLMACPGYPELIGEMINLNIERKLTAFVVGDSPARLSPQPTILNEWALNASGNTLQDDDSGLVSFDEYTGVFYPWGYTSDNFGRNIAVPPSHMIMRTIALSDQVSYPWFAPAGTRRGGITNASAVGYITSEGEFSAVTLNEGQRDVLYNAKVNPIARFTSSGLVNFGQKTRARNASALDRINVARLVIYLRSQLDKLARPFIFEPNDKITRDEIKGQIDSMLIELIGLRAIEDFLTVVDETNNTPARVDRNELWVDVAISPVRAIEFIYIPIRLKNTGEIAGL